MPNIPTYSAQDPESVIRIPDIAAEAWSSAARNIGRLGQEGAEATRRGFQQAAEGLKEFGNKLEQHQDAQDQLKLTNGLTDMELRHEQQRQSLMTDPSISPADLPGRLNDAFQQHMAETQQFATQFGGSSDKIKEEIAKQTGDLRLRMFKRHEADAANAAGASAEDSDLRNFNNNTALLGTNGTAPFDVDNALAGNERAREARLATPGLNFQQRKLISDKYDKYGEAYVKSGIETLLQKDPSRLPEYMDRWQSNISPEMRSEFENRARAITRQKAMIGSKDEADQIVNQLLGQPPGQSAPLGGTGQPGVGGSAPGLGGPSKFVPPQPGEVAPGPQSADDPRGKIPVIRHYFSQNGINPDTAVSVARTEGLARFENPDEPSFASFQLNMQNGLGNKFQQETGLDPRDPANEDATIKWTAENWRRNGGWEPFHGAANNGINTWDGAQSGYTPRPTTNIASSAPPPVSPIPGAVRGGAVAVGDSIAAGLIRHGGVSGKENRNTMLDWSNGNTAAGFSPPDMIAQNMANLPDETFKGRPVVISTGASNAGNMKPADAEASIHQQIQIAKDKGASSITILGVGPKVGHWNATLEQIAKDEKVQFGGPIKDASDGIHPTNYRDFAHGIPIGEGSGTSQPPQQQTRGVVRGSANYATNENFGDPHTPGWEDKNLTTIQSKSGVDFQVNKQAADAFKGFIDDLEKRGYDIGSGGGYNLRNIRGGSTLSQHAYGNAIDLNPDENPMGTGPLKTNLPSNISDIAAQHGLIWGGDWQGRKDPMHFEWAGPGSARGVQYAQATPQTMTDAAPAGAGGGGGSVASTPPLSPKMVYPTEQAIFEARMARMPDVLKDDIEGRVGWETRSKQIARDAVSKYKLITENTRKALENELTNGLKQLETGEDFNYREDTIRAYLDPPVADKLIKQLAEAKEIGGQIGKIRQTPVKEIIDRLNFFADSLQTTETEGFTEHNKMVHAYAAAAMKYLKGIGMSPDPKDDNTKADPAGYLISIDPDLRAKHNQNLDNPDGAQDYARSMISRQTQLGIPEDRQHILPKQDADHLARQLLSNPRDAAVNLQSFYHRWGDHTELAWRDLVEQGNLPPAFQLMPQLDPTAANLLARGLSQQEDVTGKLTPADRAGKNESFWKNMVGDQQYKATQDQLRESADVRKFRVSLMDAGASRQEVEGFLSGLDTLALSKSAYDSHGATSVDGAVGYAINSAINNNYTWLGSMNARVPKTVYSTVSDNADLTLQNLNRETMMVPTDRRGYPIYGGKGQTSVETYIAQVKSAQNWVTTRHGDGIQLLDQSRNPVLRQDGSPVILKFSDPRMQGTVITPAPPYNGP